MFQETGLGSKDSVPGQKGYIYRKDMLTRGASTTALRVTEIYLKKKKKWNFFLNEAG